MCSESGRSSTPDYIKEMAQNVHDNLLPEKSKHVYIKVYTNFKDWCLTKKISTSSENVLLVYFQEQAQNKKASSLWATFSMLKSTLALKENVDVSKYFKLISFLKRQNTAYKPKKSATFSREEINKFLIDASNAFLTTKTVLVIGVAGACRIDEMCHMLLRDIDVRDDIIIINIPNSKNGTSRKFVLMEPLWIQIVKDYLGKRPIPDMQRVFLTFRGGKPTRQNMGHNTFSKMPKTIATFLKLQNVECYTGHSFRHTSATILVESGGDLLSLKRHGGWKSATVAEGYIEESLADKKRIAEMVQGISTETSNLVTTSTAATVGQHYNPILAASVCSSPMPQNAVINIPMGNLVGTSLSTATSGPDMTYHNCTVNYYYLNK